MSEKTGLLEEFRQTLWDQAKECDDLKAELTEALEQIDRLDTMVQGKHAELTEAREHIDWLEKASTMALRWEQGRRPPSDSC